MNNEVHESAIVDDGAVIGRGTKIWHFSHVCSGASIGDRCSLGQNVFVGNGVSIGNQVKIQNNVSVYEGVTLEDDVFCGPSMVFTNVLMPRSAFPRTDRVYDQTLVRRGVTIGANATIVCGITIGKHAFIGAGAVITHDVPEHAIMIGVPAKQSGWMSEAGCPLTFNDGVGSCEKSGQRYRLDESGQVEKTPS
ncbi:MAG: N-acetyltransferase [Planctomycetaceae bacterium]|nr:N-acetyltransferase [Planctomycetaceae bacterium]